MRELIEDIGFAIISGLLWLVGYRFEWDATGRRERKWWLGKWRRV